MLIWLFVVAALALAGAGAAYAVLRLKPAIKLLLEGQRRLSAELNNAAPALNNGADDGWRNDERRLSRLLDKQQALSARLGEDAALMKKDVKEASDGMRRNAEKLDKLTALLNRSNEAGPVARLDRLEANLSRHPGVNAARTISHSRQLSDEACRRILEELCPSLGLELSERHIYDLANRVCMLESQCHGRLATSVDAMLIRMIAAIHIAQDSRGSFKLAEIGVLYGVGVIALHDAARFYAKETHVTLIDPLDGYYGAENYDFCSVKPVSRAVLEENLSICRVPAEHIEIIQDLSENAEVLSALTGREFDMLVIDGDHSREGVQRDFDNYYPFVRLGGLVVIDDYGVKEWPDIKAYADELVLPRADVQVIYKGSRTLLLRKI